MARWREPGLKERLMLNIMVIVLQFVLISWSVVITRSGHTLDHSVSLNVLAQHSNFSLPAQVLLSTWLPPSRHHQFVRQMSRCCALEPSYFGGHEFLCLTENMSCIAHLSAVSGLSIIQGPAKLDAGLDLTNTSTYQLHCILPIECFRLLQLAQSSCTCLVEAGLQQFHSVSCSPAEVLHLAEHHLIGYIEKLTGKLVNFASKGATWIAHSGGDRPAPFITPPVQHAPSTSTSGTRIVVSLADGRPQLSHSLLYMANLSVIPLVNYSSPSFHGTHLASVIVGDNPSEPVLRSYRGINPEVGLIICETSTSDLELDGKWRIWKSSVSAGAAIHVDPWGTVIQASREGLFYTKEAYDVDSFFWQNRDVLNIRALGIPAEQGSYTFAESSSKNSLIVGSSFSNTVDVIEQYSMFFPPTATPNCEVYGSCNTTLSARQFCDLVEKTSLMPHDRWFCDFQSQTLRLLSSANSGEADFLFSGLYLSDGRIRPHVVLPGTGVVSALPGSSSPIGPMSGTSVSAAVAGGMVSVISSHLTKEFKWPEIRSSAGTRPSASLLRAITLAGAQILSGEAARFHSTSLETLPESPSPAHAYAGYGRPQLNLIIPGPGVEFSLSIPSNEDISLLDPISGDAVTYRKCYELNRLGLLRVALTWADPPTAFLSSAVFVNSLKLTVSELRTGQIHSDSLQSGNEIVLPVFPLSNQIQITVEAARLIHDGSFSLVVLSSPVLALQEIDCPSCISGVTTACPVAGGVGQTVCSASGAPGPCQIVSCQTGYIPVASQNSCRVLPNMFVLTTATSAAVAVMISLSIFLLICATWSPARLTKAQFSRIHLMSLIHPWSFMLFLISGACILSSLLNVFGGLLTSSALDKARDPETKLVDFRALLAGVVASNIGEILCNICAAVCATLLGVIGSMKLRHTVAKSYINHEIARILSQAHSITGEVIGPCGSIMHHFPGIALSSSSAFGKLMIGQLIVFCLHWPIALGTLGCLCFMTAATVVTSILARWHVRRSNFIFIQLQGVLTQSMRLLEWVKITNVKFSALYSTGIQLTVAAYTWSILHSRMSAQLQAGAAEITAVIVFCVALRSLQTGGLTYGILILLFQNLSQAISAFQQLCSIVNRLGQFLGDSETLVYHLNDNHRLLGRRTIDEGSVKCWQLSAKNLSFHYPNTSVGFSNLSFALPVGVLSMLMGPSGIGKSSLMRVLARLVMPEAGCVLLNDTSISELTEEFFFRRVTLVEQDVMLKKGSLRHNVCIGQDVEDLSPDLLRLAEAIGALSWVNATPLGWETPVTPGGTSLSGGQRKMIGILRALARDTEILLTDELTSGLDPRRAYLVLKALSSTGRTVLMTTHQLELVPFAQVAFTMTSSQIVNWTAPLKARSYLMNNTREQFQKLESATLDR